MRGVNVAVVSLDFTGFPELHLSCLLNLNIQNTYMETNLEIRTPNRVDPEGKFKGNKR